MTRWLGVLAAVLRLAGVIPVTAVADAVPLANARQVVLINLAGGLPGRWLACQTRCTGSRAVERPGDGLLLRPVPGGGRIEWLVPGDEAATSALNGLEYEATVFANQRGTTVLVSSLAAWDGLRLVHRYSLAPDSRVLEADLQIPARAHLRLAGGRDLAPDPLPGLGAFYSDVRVVRVGADGQLVLAREGEASGSPATIAAGDWAGIRGRFWTLLAQSPGVFPVQAGERTADEPELLLSAPSARGSTLRLRWYGGPVAKEELERAAPELNHLLYAALWEPLRQLSFGLYWILERWQRLVGNWGLSILLLSLSVKLLMAPLIWFAERWQADVNRTQSLLAPELAAIKREFRGEEAHARTLAVYRKHGVSMFYTVKSLAGFLIQIPVFIAAFDMLGENFGLHGANFLWISDLAAPDRFAALPGTVPFLGGHLHLLPVLMTALTVLAAWLQEDASLSPDLRAAQRLKLYAMATLFFFLLYTFPAGMVLYWTANNLWHLVRVLAARLLRGATTAVVP